MSFVAPDMGADIALSTVGLTATLYLVLFYLVWKAARKVGPIYLKWKRDGTLK